MLNIHIIEKEQRKKDMPIDEDKRINMSMENEKLEALINLQKWKHDGLLELIDHKEKKKLMVANVSFVLFTVLAGMVAGIIALIAKENMDSIVRYSLYVSLLILIIGVNLINLSVIKLISALKREIMLALRELNCTRQSMQAMVFASIEGVYPGDHFRENYGEPNSKLYWQLIGQHIKYPLDNELLRNIYFKTNTEGKYVNDYKALYRSADLFTMCAIMLFTAFLSIIPIVVYGNTHYQAYSSSGTFDQGIWFALLTAVVLLSSVYSFCRIVRSFFATVAAPLVLTKP